MLVNKEIEVLDAQGIDPMTALVMPRILSMIISVFCLAIVIATAMVVTKTRCYEATSEIGEPNLTPPPRYTHTHTHRKKREGPAIVMGPRSCSAGDLGTNKKKKKRKRVRVLVIRLRNKPGDELAVCAQLRERRQRESSQNPCVCFPCS